MIARKIVLSFPTQLVDKPIIYRLVKEFGLEFNILKAAITQDEEGLLIMELKGDEDQYNRGIHYLEEIGVTIQPLSRDVVLVDEKCVSCGACVPHCPSGALVSDPESKEIVFQDEKCIACEMCVKICPFGAMEIKW